MQNKHVVGHRVMMRRMEFSKKIFVAISVMVAVVVVFTLVMVAITRDLTPLLYLIPAVFTELTVGTAFYYNKAKAENIEKITNFGEGDFNK